VTGAYSVESPTVQPNGNVKAKATDVNGNISTEIINPYADTTVPVTPTLLVSDSDSNGKINVSDVSTTIAYVDTALPLAPTLLLIDSDSDEKINASGVAEASSTVTITWPDGTISTVVADAVTGAYSVESPTVQESGNVVAKVTDVNGNMSVTTTTYYTDVTPPVILNLAIVSATGIQNNFLNAGDTLTLDVGMIQRVNVTGTPLLSLNIGGTIVQASYLSGSGTNTLKFTYTILAGQNDANGISINANSLSLNGGTIKDFAGNNLISTHTSIVDNISYKVDTTPPAAPSLSLATDSGSNASDGITNVPAINVGSIESGAIWEYKIDGGAWTTGSASSFNAIVGSHTYYVRQTDLAGNLGASSVGVAYNYDITPPAAPSLSLATDSGSSASDGITNISTINVASIESGASWQYKIDSGAWNTGTGSSFTAIAGTHTYYVRQTDVAGNLGNASTGVSYTFDITPPVAPSLSLAVDSGSNTTDGITNVATINVSGLESGASWQYSIDGGAWTNGSGTSFNASAGNHTYYIRQTDVAGNTSASSSGSVYNLDTIAPTAPSLSLAVDSGSSSNDGITSVSTINVGGLESGASWQYSIDGGSWTNGSASSFNASAGPHTYQVRQTDRAGNTSAPSVGVIYNLDISAPIAPSLSLAVDSGSSASDGITNVSTINVSGLESGASWAYSVDGGTWTSGSGSSFNASSGNHTYYVRQTDTAGNGSGWGISTYTLDTSTAAPNFSITDNVGSVTGTVSSGGTTDDNNLYISGTAEAN
ncbi:MAG: beta strand repeat-containing protein, partial [Prevotella sp.]